MLRLLSRACSLQRAYASDAALQANRNLFFKKLGDGHAVPNVVRLLWNTPLAAQLPPLTAVSTRDATSIALVWEQTASARVELLVRGKSPCDPFLVLMAGKTADGGRVSYAWSGTDVNQAVTVVLNQLRALPSA
jgi:hypothetical protein